MCSPGTHAPSPGAVSCRDCDPGSFSPQSVAAACTLCPTGRYSVTAGSSAFADCQQCAPGSFVDTAGATDPSECKQCAPGSYSSEGASACEHCEGGKFNPSEGSGECAANPVSLLTYRFISITPYSHMCVRSFNRGVPSVRGRNCFSNRRRHRPFLVCPLRPGLLRLQRLLYVLALSDRHLPPPPLGPLPLLLRALPR